VSANQQQIVKLENIPLAFGFRDLGIEDPNKRLWQGDPLKNKDGVWTLNDIVKPHGTLMLVPFVFRAIQHIEDSGIFHEDNMVEILPDQPLPDDEQLEAWNKAVPKNQWQDGLNNDKREPWRRSYGGYFINPIDGSLSIYLNTTNGARVCIEKLKSQIERMSAMRGRTLGAIVELRDRAVSKEFKKLGPFCLVVGWFEIGNGPKWLAATTNPRFLTKSDTSRLVDDRKTKKFDPSSWSEILDDDLPDDLK
jgi:hypothetical protein